MTLWCVALALGMTITAGSGHAMVIYEMACLLATVVTVMAIAQHVGKCSIQKGPGSRSHQGDFDW